MHALEFFQSTASFQLLDNFDSTIGADVIIVKTDACRHIDRGGGGAVR